MTQLIFEGGVYVKPRHETDLFTQTSGEPIEALDDPFSGRHRLSFTLDYPFSVPFKGTVVNRDGVSLRDIIEAVRAGYLFLYEDAKTEDIPGMANKRVSGAFGTALHVIDDLVIERIEFDENTGELDIFIGS